MFVTYSKSNSSSSLAIENWEKVRYAEFTICQPEKVFARRLPR